MIARMFTHTHSCSHPYTLFTRTLLPHTVLQSVAWRRIPNTVRESVSYFKRAEGDASVWGKAVATVDTSAARAFAYRWCLASYEHVEGHVKSQGQGTLRKVIYENDSHAMLFVVLVRVGGVLADRVLVTSFTWREEDDGSFLIAWAPVEEVSDAASSRATSTRPPSPYIHICSSLAHTCL